MKGEWLSGRLSFRCRSGLLLYLIETMEHMVRRNLRPAQARLRKEVAGLHT
jgi:hypothetical protein